MFNGIYKTLRLVRVSSVLAVVGAGGGVGARGGPGVGGAGA